MKKLNDVKKDSQQPIDLRGKYAKEAKEKAKLKKKENLLFKTKSPINKVQDLAGEKNQSYLYIRGKKFEPPKYLNNLIRIGIFGILIVIVINSVNVYFTGKALEEEVSRTANEGYNLLIDAGRSATKIQFDQALEAFDKAIENFSEAEDDLWFISSNNSFYSKNNQIGVAATALLESGKHFATAGKHFLDAVESFNQIPIYFVSKNETDNQFPLSITDLISDGLAKTDLAIQDISAANEKIANIDESKLPTKISARVTFAKQKIEEISTILNNTADHFPAILKLLGDRYPHRYLILLQNNNEIRPTGGFIGSYAIMDINDGYIEKLETHDVYDIDGSYGGLIEPPDEFKAFTSNWRFRDSNYSPDFSVSAKKARWFLEIENGPTVDTVISINQGLLRDMLEITGPVQVGNFGALNAENYNLLLSFIIEGKVWGPEDPKHILKMFVPAFKEAILKEENLSRMSSKIYKAIQQKHIMMYSADEDIQALFETVGVSGNVYRNKEDEDYLSIINIATGGTKSEQFIEEAIHHNTDIDELGNITDEITLTRTHLWTNDIYLRWREILQDYGFSSIPDEIIDILGRGANKVSTRIYVPNGSVLLESNAPNEVTTKYDKDLQKTYFFTTTSIEAGETAEVYIKYRPPMTLKFNPTATYKLIVEKQPGSIGSILTKTLNHDSEIKNLAVYPPQSKVLDTGATYATNLVYDRYFSTILERD